MGYDIDDILSEVKKRREENEAKIKSDAGMSLDSSKIDEVKPEPVVEDIEPQVQVEEVINDGYVDISSESEVPQEEVEEVVEETTDTSISLNELAMKEEDEYTDLFSTAGEDEYTEEQGKKPKKKKKKIIISILCVILALLIAGGVGTWFYVDKVINQITETDQPKKQEDTWKGMDELVESFETIEEEDASHIASFQDMIYQWYKNGVPCSSTHVLNIMLIGEDTRGTDIKEDGTRADSAIICSINTDTKKITLTSILRDTYAYWENEKGNEDTGHFNKINGAMAVGDVNVYIDAVESLYKINIDNYVIVNFDSFKSIIDTLGGVELELTSKEINEINSHQKRYGNVTIEKTFDGTKGKVKLNGKQALAYCRIRKIDSDNERANRQKKCLNKIFDKVKDASSVQLIKILNSLVPYVKTDMSKNEIVKVGKYAIKQGWQHYKVVNNSIPDSRINEKGAGGIFYGTWCWKSDFPQDAYNLQTLIYGRSSIVLARTRVDVLNCELNGFYAKGSSSVTATFTNENYGEVSTLKAELTEETSKKE